jgi:hypothetical protein
MVQGIRKGRPRIVSMYTGTDDVIALVKFAHPGTDFDHAASCLDTCKGKLNISMTAE